MDVDDKLLLFAEYYHYLESSFTDVIRIIPLENHPETFSPRLYEILHSIGSQIEGVLKLMCGEVGMRYTNFPETYANLNYDGAISMQEVFLKNRPKWNAIKPFQCDFACHCRTNPDEHACSKEREKPKWWEAYNESKHNLPEGYREGTIENTYLALTGLYGLHHMMRFQTENKDDFLKHDSWFKLETLVIGDGRPHSYTLRATKLSTSMFGSNIRFGPNNR